MADQSLFIRIKGTAEDYKKALGEAKKGTKDLEEGLLKATKISAAGFAVLTAAAAGSIKAFTDFEDKFSAVVTLLDESSFQTKSLTEGIEGLKSDILDLGAKSGESFDNLNQGLFDLISAGVPAEQATKALTEAVNLADAGATDTATSVKALTAAMTAYGSEAGDARAISEKFFTAQKFGVTDVGKLAREFNKVAGTAKTLGISFDEALASATALTANGAKPTAQAFTEYRAVLVASIDAQQRLKSESYEVQKAFSLENIRTKGLKTALDELVNATGGNVITMKRLLGSSEALSAALSLTGEQSGLVNKIFKELGDETQRQATYQDALTVRQERSSKGFAKLARNTQALAIEIGEKLAPSGERLASALNSIVTFLRGASGPLSTVISLAIRLTGAFTALSLTTLSVIKIKNAFIALRAALTGARLAAVGFTSALTFGLTAVIAFLPEIIEGFKKVFTTVDKFKGRSLSQLNDQLGILKTKLEDAKKAGKGGFLGESASVVKLKAEISQLEGAIAEKKKLEEQERKDREQKELEHNKKLNQIKEKSRIEESAAVQEANAVKEQRDLERREREIEYNEIYNQIKDDQRTTFDEKEKEQLLRQVKTKEDIAKKRDLEAFQREQKRREQFLSDEMEFGTNLAEFKALLNTQEVENAKNTAAQLAQLQFSKNNQLKAIGKAAALVQIGISTAEGAIKAYSSLAGIPIFGPGLGIAAATALSLYGAERAREVAGFNQGGFVPGLGSGDIVPALLEPGELVVPKQVAKPFLEEVQNSGQGVDLTGNNQPLEIVLSLKDEFSEFIEASFNERENLNISIRGI